MATRTNQYTSLNFNDIYEKKSPSSSSTTTTTSAKSPSSSLSSSAQPNKSYSLLASSRLNGMLVLSRPSPPKPLLSPPLSPSPKPPSPLICHQHHRPLTPPPAVSVSDQITTPSSSSSSNPSSSSNSNSISLRPHGSYGAGVVVSGGIGVSSSFMCLEKENNKVAAKSDKFVPPHLRPGFVAREQKPVPPPTNRSPGNFRPGSGGHGYGNYGSMNINNNNNWSAENGRPKSGGGGVGFDRRMRGGGIGVGVGVGELDLGVLNRPRSGGTGTRPSSSGCAD